MAYLTEKQLKLFGFRSLGFNVKISDKASIYDAQNITIGDNSRIDDFCVISGKIQIGKFVHITPMCLIAGGELGVILSDFCTLAYGVKVFSQSDDYSGDTMVNSLICKKYKNEKMEKVLIGRQVIIGANSVVFPGVEVAEGCSIGAMSLVMANTSPWGIYVGIPSKRLKHRSKKLLELEKQFLKGH